jgi:hypothetical protein
MKTYSWIATLNDGSKIKNQTTRRDHEEIVVAAIVIDLIEDSGAENLDRIEVSWDAPDGGRLGKVFDSTVIAHIAAART